MCPICNNHLIPVVYGFVGEKYLDAHRKGLIFLVEKTFHTKQSPMSYCPICEECFDMDVPVPPL
jgi:hypothetical protein